jgi:sec-independent protein translocase protein TatA
VFIEERSLMGLGLSNPTHIGLIVVVLLLVFGAKRLPEMGRSLGSGLREFKDSVTGSSDAPQTPAITSSRDDAPRSG